MLHSRCRKQGGKGALAGGGRGDIACLYNGQIKMDIIMAHVIPSCQFKTCFTYNYVLMLGLLSAVTSSNANLINSTVYITWTPPNNDSDITYCVDVMNSTSISTLHSECGITGTEYSYPLPHKNWCDIYFFSIIPVNQVGNGTIHIQQGEIQNRM